MKFYLAREGVAFGPYTEFQIRESVRLGIFASVDLALAEDGKEWKAVGELLPPPHAMVVISPGEPDGTAQRVPLPSEKPKPVGVERHPGWHQLSVGRRNFGLATIPIAAALCFVGIWGTLEHSAKTNSLAQAAAQSQKRSVPSPRAGQPGLTATVVEPTQPIVPERVDLIETVDTSAEVSVTPSMALSAPVIPAHPSPEQSTTDSQPLRRIEGKILIAAKDGRNYQPSSVEVRLYPLALLKPYLEKRGSEASAKFEQLKTQIVAAEAEKEQFRKAADAAFDEYVQAGPDHRRALEQVSADAKKAREQATNAYYDLLNAREDLLSGAFYLEDLPKADEVTRTDAQGRFSFEIPMNGDFAVVAGAQSGKEASTERYYWFVPVSVDDEPRKTVLLSNNNVSSRGSVDSLVQTAN